MEKNKALGAVNLKIYNPESQRRETESRPGSAKENLNHKKKISQKMKRIIF